VADLPFGRVVELDGERNEGLREEGRQRQPAGAGAVRPDGWRGARAAAQRALCPAPLGVA
jgi:hypothetical protein